MLAVYLTEKCKAQLMENKRLIMEKLSDPSSWVTVDVSGKLVDAAKGGMSGLASFAEDYVEKNADALAMSALKATGLESTFMDAYNLVMNMMSAAIMARNDLVLRMMKEVAWGCMRELAAKDDILITLAEQLKQLHLALASLVGVQQNWPDYYNLLRKALGLVDASGKDLGLVRNSLYRNDFWLGRKFDGTITKLEEARDILTPKKNNPAIQAISEGSYKVQQGLKTGVPDKTKPKADFIAQTKKKTALIASGLSKMEKGLAYFGDGLSDSYPFPTSSQQWQATVAIGKLSNQILNSLQGYFEATSKVNALVLAFQTGLDTVSSTLPSFYKNYVISLLDTSKGRLDTLRDSMALAINGSETALTRPITGFRPNSLTTTVQSLNWIMDINLILQGYKLIPAKQLSKLNLDKTAVDTYKSIVAQLQKMDDLRSGLAILRMTDGQEDPGDLETQILTLLMEANNAIVSSSVRKGILQLSRATLSRLELSLVRDDKIFTLMQQFWYVELPLQDTLNQVFDGLIKALDNAGLDRMKDALLGGDFKKLFNLKGRDATYVGAALAAVSLLKKCFKTGPERDKIANVEADLNSDADLLNITFTINFDLAIFKNLSNCLQLNGLAEFFKIKQNLCGILTDALKDSPVMSSMFTKMNSLFSTWGGF
jgi:hypothetical protein